MMINSNYQILIKDSLLSSNYFINYFYLYRNSICLFLCLNYIVKYGDNPIPMITDYSKDYSFRLESSYICASVTRGKEFVKDSVLLEKDCMPPPFMFLNVIKTKGSSGKCWVFHRSYKGKVLGYFFPSGYRILGITKLGNIEGEYYLENRNFQSSKHGLLGVLLPKEPVLSKINICELILVTRLFENENGILYLTFLRYLTHDICHDSLNLLRDKNILNKFFPNQ